MWPHGAACTGLHTKSVAENVLGLPSPVLFQLGSVVIHWWLRFFYYTQTASCLWSRSDTWWYFNKLKYCKLLLPLASSALSSHLSREDNILSFTCSSYCLHNFLWGTLTQAAPGILLYRKENKKETLCIKPIIEHSHFLIWGFLFVGLLSVKERYDQVQMPHVCGGGLRATFSHHSSERAVSFHSTEKSSSPS